MLLLLYVKEVKLELPVFLILLSKPKNGGYFYFKQGNSQAAMQKILIELRLKSLKRFQYSMKGLKKGGNKDLYFLFSINMRES